MISGKQFMKIAREISNASHCISEHVGAVIVKDDRIVSTGYNGTPQGYTNCDEIHTERGDAHSAWSSNHEIHAEMNAIIFAAKTGISIDGAVMYSTLSPCRQCLKHLKQAGIIHIYFEDMYRRTSTEQHTADQLFCADIGIGMTQLSTFESLFDD